MRFLAVFLFITCLSCQTKAQDKAISAELGGLAGIYSLNIERPLKTTENRFWSIRIGLGVVPIDKNNGASIYLPMAVNLALGETDHKLDLSAGQTITITTKGSFHPLTTLGLGYKYEPADKNWFLRVQYTPLISYLFDFQYQNWAGLGFGLKLKRK